MLKIIGYSGKLYQWNTGRKLQVIDPPGCTISEVHMYVSTWENAVVRKPDRSGATVTVDIPDEALQVAGPLMVYEMGVDASGRETIAKHKYVVYAQEKPDDYVYTPTELKAWADLDARIAALEATNVQPNWDQNDDSAADYVRGRTHYVGAKHDVKIINQKSGEFTPELGLIVGNTYRVWYDGGHGFVDGDEFICKDFNDGKDGMEPTPYVGTADETGRPNPYLIFDNNIELHLAFAHVVTVVKWKIEGDFADIKTLDSRYLDPELLERIEKLENGGGVAGVSSVNGQTGAVELTAKGLGALTEDDLQSATDKALAQAKASGEFDGPAGATPVKGTDYWTAADQAAIVRDTLAALPTWTGGSY